MGLGERQGSEDEGLANEAPSEQSDAHSETRTLLGLGDEDMSELEEYQDEFPSTVDTSTSPVEEQIIAYLQDHPIGYAFSREISQVMRIREQDASEICNELLRNRKISSFSPDVNISRGKHAWYISTNRQIPLNADGTLGYKEFHKSIAQAASPDAAVGRRGE